MNLISHFVCAAPLTPAGRMGSVLPDLLRMVGRRPRALALLQKWEQGTPVDGPMAELLEGIRFHHQVDSAFHAAPLFTETATALRRTMQAASTRPGLKRFFAAHLLCEIYYDHLLMVGDPALCDEFHGLLAWQGELATRFAAIHPATDPGAVPRLLQRVLADRFVEDYRTHQGIFFRANRVLARLGQRAADQAETDAVASFFFAEAPRLTGALLQFTGTVQRWAREGATAPQPPAAAAGAPPPGLVRPVLGTVAGEVP